MVFSGFHLENKFGFALLVLLLRDSGTISPRADLFLVLPGLQEAISQSSGKAGQAALCAHSTLVASYVGISATSQLWLLENNKRVGSSREFLRGVCACACTCVPVHVCLLVYVRILICV